MTKTYWEGELRMSNINSCPFCQEFVKENSNILNESRIIAETNSFAYITKNAFKLFWRVDN